MAARGPTQGGLAPYQWVGLLCALALALWVRIGLIPAFPRHAWEGHEAEYLAVFQGDWHGAWSTRVVPLLGWVYRAMGAITTAPGALVALSLAASLASIAALVLLLRRQVGAGPALLAGALVALYGNHAFWSSSAYNVMLPHALLLGAMALLSARGWASCLGAAVLMGAAAGGRVELILLALPAALLLHHRRWPQRLAWCGLTALVFAALAGPMLGEGAYPSGMDTQLADALRLNLALPVFLQPFSSAPPLALALLLAALGIRRYPRAGLTWLALFLVGHCSSAGFADSGFRQALLPGVALCALQAMGIHGIWQLAGDRRGAARALPCMAAGLSLAVVVSLLALDSLDVARRYYAPAPSLIRELEAVNPEPVHQADRDGCRELNTSPARDSDELGPLDVRDWDTCWLWLEDFQHRRWISLGVHDRARRMHYAFELQPLGMDRESEDPGQPPRQVWRVLGPR